MPVAVCDGGLQPLLARSCPGRGLLQPHRQLQARAGQQGVSMQARKLLLRIRHALDKLRSGGIRLRAGAADPAHVLVSLALAMC
jgi:transposase